MNTSIYSCLGRAGLLSGAIFLGATFVSRAQETPRGDAFPNWESYIKVSGQAADITGDKSAFQSRTQKPSDGGLGIEDLHLSRDLSKATSVTVDGHALSGSEDYLGQVNVTKNEIGSVEVGYKRFRTFYDGVGGFFPLSNQWNQLSDEELHIDRSKFWAQATLNLPQAPKFVLRYTNELRNGRKDSTEWGSSDLTGLPFNAPPNPISPARKGVPDTMQVGERHEHLELTVTHKVAKTEMVLTLLGDRTRNLDTRYVTNYPGELIPWSIASLPSTVPAGQVANPQQLAKAADKSGLTWNNQAQTIQSDGMATKTSGVTLETVTELTSQLTLNASGSYELLYNNITGDRTLVTQTATSTAVVPVVTDNNQNLFGGVHVKEAVGSVSLNYKPIKTLAVKFGVKAQDEWIKGTSTYNVLAASGTPATNITTTPRVTFERQHANSQTPVLEVRYTGIKDLALYFTGSKRNLNGVKNNSSAYNPLTAANGTLALYNEGEDHGDYTVGANWKPIAPVSLRAEVFTKGHKDSSSGYGVQVGDYYLLDYKTTGYKLTAITKVTPELSLTTRFVAAHSKSEITGFLPTYPAFDALNGKNYSINETIDYTPTNLVYFQLNGSAIYNVISTIYPRAGTTPAAVNAAGLTTANAFDTNRILQNSDNNYVTGSFLSGFVVDKDTDAQVQVSYYRSQNGNPYLQALTMPFGVAIRDTSVTVGLKHKFSERWVGNAKIGYFESKNDTTGGFTNFHGPLAYVAISHAL